MQEKLRAEGRLFGTVNPFSFDLDNPDPDVAAFHRLRKQISGDQSYVSLLGHMRLRH